MIYSTHFSQTMDKLPIDRVTPLPSFSSTGVDCGGPFLMHEIKGGGCKLIKVYISLITCLVTKEIERNPEYIKQQFLLENQNELSNYCANQ